jgi:asparagine synthase (glutamine-hydrolysing)
VDRYLDWLSLFDRETLTSLLRPEVACASAPDGVREQAATSAPGIGAPLLDRLLYLNFTTYLPDDLHVKVDRMSMANALEQRSPMLDTALIEYVAALPPDLKVRGSRLKVLLREAFRDLVPPTLLRRRKHGFGVPVERWFAGEMRGMAGDLLLAPDSRVRRWLDPEPLRRLLEEHVSGRRANGHRLWTLVNLELWCRMLEDGSLTQPVTEDTGGVGEIDVFAGRE